MVVKISIPKLEIITNGLPRYDRRFNREKERILQTIHGIKKHIEMDHRKLGMKIETILQRNTSGKDFGTVKRQEIITLESLDGTNNVTFFGIRNHLWRLL